MRIFLKPINGNGNIKLNFDVLFTGKLQRKMGHTHILQTNWRSSKPNMECQEAIKVFVRIKRDGKLADNTFLSRALNACAQLEALEHGKEIHGYAVRSGFESDVLVGNKLISMYTKCANLGDARQVFDKMPQRDMASWNAMVVGYSRAGYCEEALDLFHQMKTEGMKLDLISRTAMISGFVENGYDKEAMELFYRMQLAGLQPNSLTISSILPSVGRVHHGREIHSFIIRTGVEENVFVRSALVDMYSRCHNLEDAWQLFDKTSEGDVVSWNTMIAGCVENGRYDLALNLFDQMRLLSLKPNSITIASVLPACAYSAGLKYGKEIHQYIVKNDINPNVFVETALLDMYAKCGSIEDARHVFDEMLQRGVASWNAMIAGYAQNGHGIEALKLFPEMQIAGMKPNSITMASLFPACAHMTAMQQGKEIHSYVIRIGSVSNVFVANALIDMYAKCGSVNDARIVFDKMSTRSLASWNAMITAYGLHGRGEESIAIFKQMQQRGLTPDHITFTGLLSACTHAGMVDEGLNFFYCMSFVYHVIPHAEHYACVVDLLGRAGRLDEAHDIFNSMPFEPTASVCGALLASCRTHCNVELGELMAEHLFKLEPENAGNYISLSSIYSATCRWDDAARVRKMMRDRGVENKPGCSWIEINSKMHAFTVDNKSHPEWT